MKMFILGAALLVTTSATVSAADMAVRSARPAPVAAPVEMYNWSGLYIGGQVGGAWLRAQENFVNDVGIVDPNLTFRASSFIGGGHAGAQAQWGAVVLGIEGTYNFARLNETVPSIVPGAPRVRSVDVQDIATIVGKLGYAAGPVLFYVKGGWAGMQVETTSLNPALALSSTSGGNWHSGWTIGGGIDYMFARNWIAGVDLNYYTVGFNGTQVFSNGALGSVSNSRAEVFAATARLTYLFNWGGGPVVARY